MIFKNKKTYIINRISEIESNEGIYDLDTTNDFIFEATFNLVDNKSNVGENCVISREGYNMGIYVYNFEGENFIKWVWWEVDNEMNPTYNEIFVHKKYNLSEITNVKVVKKETQFDLFVNGELYESKSIKFNLFDYSDKSIIVGSSNPANLDNSSWFDGEIHDVKIYNSSDENIDTLYVWFDFKNNTTTKIFDKSGNNLNAEIFKVEVKSDDNKKIKKKKTKSKFIPSFEKKAYIVNRYSNSKTNTKSYDYLKKDFIIETTFRLSPNSIIDGNETCIVSREGSLGFFVFDYKNEYFLKCAWHEINENGEVFQNEIFVHDEYDFSEFTTVKVIKKGKYFTLYINGELYKKRKIEYKLYDYTDARIFIGAGNPYCMNNNHRWFYGEIKEVKIYHSAVESDENLYVWYDFDKQTSFKVFDKSGNGNHAEIYESEETKSEKSIEFNELARPAKII